MMTEAELTKGGAYVWRLGDPKHQATLVVTQITKHLVYAKLIEDGKPVGKRFFNDKGMFLQECTPVSAPSAQEKAMKFTGRVIDVGDMEEGRGARVQVGNRTVILVGLTMDETRELGKALGEDVTFNVGAVTVGTARE